LIKTATKPIKIRARAHVSPSISKARSCYGLSMP